MTNQTFAHLKALSNQDGKDFPTKRIALLADTSSQYLAKAIRGEGISRSLNLELFEADYNQIELQLFQPGSELQEFSPETVIVYQDVTKLRRSFHKVAPSERSVFAEQQIASVERYYEAATKAGASSFLYCNFPVLPDAVFGNFANKTDDSFVWQSRELNLGVMKMASKLAGFHVCDVSALAARIGYERALDRRMYVNADVAMSFDFLPVVAQNVVDVLLSLQGKVKKCLILDLDKRSRIGQNVTHSRRVVKNATEIAIFNRQYVDLDLENWSHFSFLFKQSESTSVFDFATNNKRQSIEEKIEDIVPSVFPSVRSKAA